MYTKGYTRAFVQEVLGKLLEKYDQNKKKILSVKVICEVEYLDTESDSIEKTQDYTKLNIE